MKAFKLFASQHPLIFGLVITFVFILMLVVSAVLGNLWPGEVSYGQPGGIVGRLAAIVLLLMALSRLGWLRSAGFSTLGGWIAWLVLLLPLAYAILGSSYAMTGDLDFNLSDPALTSLVVLFILTAAFLEEVAFRGLILHALFRVWGSTYGGLIKSILVSSLLFCMIHLLDYLSGRPFLEVLLQSLQAFFLGIWLGALVLRGKSIYPAALFHAILNLAAYLTFASKGIQPAPASWVLLSLIMLPLALSGIYLLRGLPDWSGFPGTTQLINGE